MALKQTKAVPAEVTALAIARNFGPLRLTARRETSRMLIATLMSSWFLVLLMGAVTLSLVVVGIFSGHLELLLAALLPAAALASLLYLGPRYEMEFTTSHPSFYVFRDGFIIQRDSTNEALSWAEITTLWRAGYRTSSYRTPTRYSYTLQCADGRKVKLGTMPRRSASLQLFDDMLVREVTNQRLPEALRALNAGQTLEFGPFSLGMGGLTHKQATLSWNEVRRVYVGDGYFSIYKVGKRLPWGGGKRVARIPNFSVFLALVERMARVN